MDTAKIDDQVLSAQMDILQSADVLVLNELDWGMKRSDYRAVVKDLADALKMNWAYGVEFKEEIPRIRATRLRSRGPGNSTKSIPKSESPSRPQCHLAINLQCRVDSLHFHLLGKTL